MSRLSDFVEGFNYKITDTFYYDDPPLVFTGEPLRRHTVSRKEALEKEVTEKFLTLESKLDAENLQALIGLSSSGKKLIALRELFYLREHPEFKNLVNGVISFHEKADQGRYNFPHQTPSPNRFVVFDRFKEIDVNKVNLANMIYYLETVSRDVMKTATFLENLNLLHKMQLDIGDAAVPASCRMSYYWINPLKINSSNLKILTENEQKGLFNDEMNQLIENINKNEEFSPSVIKAILKTPSDPLTVLEKERVKAISDFFVSLSNSPEDLINSFNKLLEETKDLSDHFFTKIFPYVDFFQAVFTVRRHAFLQDFKIPDVLFGPLAGALLSYNASQRSSFTFDGSIISNVNFSSFSLEEFQVVSRATLKNCILTLEQQISRIYSCSNLDKDDAKIEGVTIVGGHNYSAIVEKEELKFFFQSQFYPLSGSSFHSTRYCSYFKSDYSENSELLNEKMKKVFPLGAMVTSEQLTSFGIDKNRLQKDTALQSLRDANILYAMKQTLVRDIGKKSVKTDTLKPIVEAYEKDPTSKNLQAFIKEASRPTTGIFGKYGKTTSMAIFLNAIHPSFKENPDFMVQLEKTVEGEHTVADQPTKRI